jgi:hypothetical protein
MPTADLFNDLHVFDLDTLLWSDLGGDGEPPPRRKSLGLVAAGGALFVFGGMGDQRGPHPVAWSCIEPRGFKVTLL